MKLHKNNLAYICSPYRGDTKRNKEYAREITRLALVNGFVPITTHLYLTEVTDEDNPTERKMGMDAGIEILKSCEYIIIGEKYGITEGMNGEMAVALENKVKFLFAGKEDIYVTPQKSQQEAEVQQ